MTTINGNVDRIEGDWIIVVPLSGPVFQIPNLLFPDLNPGENINITIQRDEEGQNAVKDRIDKIRDNLNRIEL